MKKVVNTLQKRKGKARPKAPGKGARRSVSRPRETRSEHIERIKAEAWETYRHMSEDDLDFNLDALAALSGLLVDRLVELKQREVVASN